MTDLDSLIDDRPADGVFHIRREAFLDPEIFDLEMKHIFESTWVFVGLATQVRKPHDFFTAQIGRQPVIVSRDGNGKLHCVLNSCRHRGAMVCPLRAGNKRYHVCPYHGWSYDSAGKNVGITQQEDGEYPKEFAASNHDLVPVARFADYKGLLFASLSPDVPPLEQHLGEARTFLDLIMDQGAQGMEALPGAIQYTFGGNWKLQFENGMDFYHFTVTHASYVDLVRKRQAEGRTDGQPRWVDDDIDQGNFNFERGHSVLWSNRNSLRVVRPITNEPSFAPALAKRVGDTKAKWMQLNRNLTIWPNLQIVDVSSLQLRIWRPLAADRTEMLSWCLAPIGEDKAARRRRIRQYEEFFNPSGLATSDDNTMYELQQSGLRASSAGDTQGYLRGLGREPGGPDAQARELGISPAASIAGTFTMGAEISFHAGYREWLRLLRRGISAAASPDAPAPLVRSPRHPSPAPKAAPARRPPSSARR